MNAEVIAIGDELTSGLRLDTNTQWLSQRLGDLGIRVLYHTTVGDDLAANVRVFREAFDRAEVVVSTGGLGPTADDLTRDAVAEATGTVLELNDQVLTHIQSMFARRQRPMPEQNIVQAKFPSGSRVISNPHGTAPGIDIDVPRPDRTSSRLFALPGVPAEMREMWGESVAPALIEVLGENRRFIRHRRIKCFGIGESDLEKMLPDLIRRGQQPSVGITVSRATITLRVTAEAESEFACFEAMEPTIATIHDCLGSLIFGEEDDELQHVVVRLLSEKMQSVSVAEWGTGALVMQWLREVDFDNDHFVAGHVLSAKSMIGSNGLNSDKDIVTEFARQCRDQFNTDFGLAIGQIPKVDSQPNSQASVSIALASASDLVVKSFPLAGHPDIVIARAAKQALNMLRHTLLEC